MNSLASQETFDGCTKAMEKRRAVDDAHGAALGRLDCIAYHGGSLAMPVLAAQDSRQCLMDACEIAWQRFAADHGLIRSLCAAACAPASPSQ